MKLPIRKVISSVLVMALMAPAIASSQEAPAGTGPTARGSAGTKFEQVPVAYTENCTNTILFGSDGPYKKTSFVIPRVYAGLDVNGDTILDFQELGNDEYLFSVGLYFQVGEQGLSSRRKDSNLRIQGCDIDNVIGEFNRTRRADEQLLKPVNLMITKISAQLPGIEDKAVLGNEFTGMIQYVGTDPILTFTVKGKDKLDLINRMINSPVGMTMTLEVFFAASAQDGRLEIDMNYENMISELQGRVTAENAGRLSHGQVSTAIRSAMTKTNTRVSIQTSTSDTFNQLVSTIVADTVKAVENAGVMADTIEQESNQARNQQILDDNATANQEATARAQDRRDQRNTPPQTDPEGKPIARQVIPAIEVAAAVRYLKTKKSGKIEINNSTAVQSHSFVTQANIKAKAMAKGVIEPKLRAGVGPKKFNTPLDAGAVVKVQLQGINNEYIEYKSSNEWLTPAEIRGNKLGLYFPEINQLSAYPIFPRVTSAEQEVTEQVLGQVNRGYTYRTRFYNTGYWSWVRYYYGEKRPNGEKVSNEGIWPGTQRFQNNGREIGRMPLRFTFEKIGTTRQFNFAQILNPPDRFKDYWSAVIDDESGELIFTAKKDLGSVFIENYANTQNVSDVFKKKKEKIQKDYLDEVRAGIARNIAERNKNVALATVQAEEADAMTVRTFFRQRYSNITGDESPSGEAGIIFKEPTRIYPWSARTIEDRPVRRSVVNLRIHYLGVETPLDIQVDVDQQISSNSQDTVQQLRSLMPMMSGR